MLEWAERERATVKQLMFAMGARAHGIAVEEGVTPMGIAGTDEVREVHYRRGNVEKTVLCDAVGLGFGLKAETQLADLAGCRFRFDRESLQWLPARNGDGDARNRR